MLGNIEVTTDGRHALIFERRFAHPQAKVWRAITETEELRHWFVDILDYDRSRLAFAERATLTFAYQGEPPATNADGDVTQFDPPHLLEYTWGAEVLRWELTADGDAACLLVFTNILGDRPTAVAVAPGWHVGLDRLGAQLNGRENTGKSWELVAEDYARALG